jgi:flagellar hook-basal body complex protein FliE
MQWLALLIAILKSPLFLKLGGKRKLNSKLEENEELKSILLAETPWINDAQSESDKTKLAFIFDLEKVLKKLLSIN